MRLPTLRQRKTALDVSLHKAPRLSPVIHDPCTPTRHRPPAALAAIAPARGVRRPTTDRKRACHIWRPAPCRRNQSGSRPADQSDRPPDSGWGLHNLCRRRPQRCSPRQSRSRSRRADRAARAATIPRRIRGTASVRGQRPDRTASRSRGRSACRPSSGRSPLRECQPRRSRRVDVETTAGEDCRPDSRQSGAIADASVADRPGSRRARRRRT